eukprot:TRINITY_DN6624_c0_g1_i3.p1 TRINITY_DN6624_c0_g1~~TRINITY_DN6624_c0_g1_i3.p1  ORF type:complete len:275 (-),score=62.64 TRINITY_DN6624_c0_g1_i3:138-962(-)
MCDLEALDHIFDSYNITSVVHLAGLKAVGESVKNPIKYYHNNLYCLINLVECMNTHSVKSLVLSSSACVYGDPEEIPLKETSAKQIPVSPYGKTKMMMEMILEDLAKSDNSWEIISLRYFNPIGAHPTYLLGENPIGIPNNLMPYIAKVAAGELEKLTIFGDDWDTPDGFGVRDYVHVVDLAEGHRLALSHLRSGYQVYNLGGGVGYSVMEVVNAFQKVTGRDIPYVISERRGGDVNTLVADTSKAIEELGWNPQYSNIEQMCLDHWNYWKIHY